MKDMTDAEAQAKYLAGFGGGMNYKDLAKGPELTIKQGYAPEVIKSLGGLVTEQSHPTPIDTWPQRKG